MLDLRFNLNPVGLVCDQFTTVRAGRAWAERTKDESQRELRFLGSNDTHLGTGVSRFVWIGPAADIPCSLLELHHDPGARTFTGLVRLLTCCYTPEQVKEHSGIVTLMLIEPKLGGSIEIATHVPTDLIPPKRKN